MGFSRSLTIRPIFVKILFCKDYNPEMALRELVETALRGAKVKKLRLDRKTASAVSLITAAVSLNRRRRPRQACWSSKGLLKIYISK